MVAAATLSLRWRSLFRPLNVVALLLVVCVPVLVAGGVSARKQLPLNTPYPAVVQNALRCDVCSFIVANALYQVEAKREELQRKRLPLREDDVLEEVENMCVPFKDQGQWIRQVALNLETKPGSSQYHAEIGVVDFYSKCGRTCDTVAALCEEWMDSDDMDGFSARLVRDAKAGQVLSDASHRGAVFSAFCAPSLHCRKRTTLVSRLDAALQNNAQLREAIEADKLRKIKKEEREMETMLHRLTREQGQSADVFSRDEVRRMKDAFVSGTKEDVEAVDPTAFDLTDAEFTTLQEYMRGEERKNKPHRRESRTPNRDSDGDL
ncbi:hypothetical protein NESM_000318500 [Novymonas esmeraldas]|uniref:Uncharacterized protein n=1 Tax=Novymonas esmeraldas TaxID=1808958 RepID=A0AAW0EMG5_9TRYP